MRDPATNEGMLQRPFGWLARQDRNAAAHYLLAPGPNPLPPSPPPPSLLLQVGYARWPEAQVRGRGRRRRRLQRAEAGGLIGVDRQGQERQARAASATARTGGRRFASAVPAGPRRSAQSSANSRTVIRPAEDVGAADRRWRRPRPRRRRDVVECTGQIRSGQRRRPGSPRRAAPGRRCRRPLPSAAPKTSAGRRTTPARSDDRRSLSGQLGLAVGAGAGNGDPAAHENEPTGAGARRPGRGACSVAIDRVVALAASGVGHGGHVEDDVDPGGRPMKARFVDQSPGPARRRPGPGVNGRARGRASRDPAGRDRCGHRARPPPVTRTVRRPPGAARSASKSPGEHVADELGDGLPADERGPIVVLLEADRELLQAEAKRRASRTISASMNQSSAWKSIRSRAVRVIPFGLPFTSQIPRAPNISAKATL